MVRVIEVETPATRKTKTTVTISTEGSLYQQRKPDLVADREISRRENDAGERDERGGERAQAREMRRARDWVS
ncbi:hypothetical protein ACLOJK_030953 [Asimina triloba]